MSHRRSTVKGSLSFANPTVRAWLFQILAVVAVVGIVWGSDQFWAELVQPGRTGKPCVARGVVI